MAAENKPAVKGILKTSKSFDKDGIIEHERKEMKWDEMNILATYHPADKDYGHQKVDEPLTPYSKLKDGDIEDSDDEEKFNLDPSAIAARLEADAGPRVLQEEESSDDEDEMLTDEEKVKKYAFETKRKLHYNEFYAVKLARQLMDSDDDEEEGTGKEEAENGDGKAEDMDDSQPSSSSPNCEPSSSAAK